MLSYILSNSVFQTIMTNFCKFNIISVVSKKVWFAWSGSTTIFTDAGIGGVSKSVSLVDVDGNGDLDALVDNEGQAIRVWLNTSTTSGDYGGSDVCFVNSIYFYNRKQG